jgi:hypothetical protein
MHGILHLTTIYIYVIYVPAMKREAARIGILLQVQYNKLARLWKITLQSMLQGGTQYGN